MDKTYKIEISAKTIVFTIFFILGLQLLWMVKALVFSLFVAFIVMSALDPIINFFERFKIPRSISSLVVLIVSLFLISGLLVSVFPPLVNQTTLLLKNFPVVLEGISPSLGKDLLNYTSQYLPDLTTQAFGVISGVFSNMVFVFSTLFFVFYFLIEKDFLGSFLTKFLEENEVHRTEVFLDKVKLKLSSWFWGELTLMIIVGTMTYVGLLLMNVPYSLPLAVIAGLLEVIPNLGPVLSSLPAFFVGLSQSYFLAFSVLALYFIVQQLENNLIVPVVMRKAVGLNPIVTLAVLIIGGQLSGISGALLAIPITLFIETLILEFARGR